MLERLTVTQEDDPVPQRPERTHYAVVLLRSPGGLRHLALVEVRKATSHFGTVRLARDSFYAFLSVHSRDDRLGWDVEMVSSMVSKGLANVIALTVEMNIEGG